MSATDSHRRRRESDESIPSVVPPEASGDEIDLLDPIAMPLSDYMDYLTHLAGPEEFAEELIDMVCVTPDGEASMSLLCSDPCLADPELSQWRDAFVWRLIEAHGDEAVVVERAQRL